MTITLQVDTLSEFRYDPTSGRYRVREGAGRGRFVSREAFLNQTQQYVERQKTELIALGDRLSSNAITLREFQRQAAGHLKEIHTGMAIIGRGGVERMRSEDWLQVGRNLRSQYYSGKDPITGQRYGIKFLVQDLIDGKVSPAMLTARLGMFAESGKLTYFQMEQQTQVDSGKAYATRHLGPKDHCNDCPGHERLVPIPIAQIIYPTTQCECKNRCGCNLRYYTIEEAIAAGMPDPNAPTPEAKQAEERFGRRRRSSSVRSAGRGFG